MLQSVVIKRWTTPRSRDGENPFSDHRVRHVLAIDAAPQEVNWAVEKVTRGGLAGLNEALDNSVKIIWHRIFDSNDKAGLLAAFQRFAEQTPCDPRTTTSMVNVLDELLTNAVYNAPLQDGVRLFASRSRTEHVTSERPVTVGFAVDSTYVAVIVKDEYGSLSPEELISNLDRCYKARLRQVQYKSGGAGLGLFMILQNASRVIFNLNQNVSTEVIVLRKHSERHGRFMHTSPTLNICTPYSAVLTDLRKYERRSVSWAALCRVDERLSLVGAVLDVSRHGAFIRLDDVARFLNTSQKIELSLIGELKPTFVSDRFGNKLLVWRSGLEIPGNVLRGTVRWVGKSQGHECDGAGLEFEKEHPALESPNKDSDNDEPETF